MTQVAIVATTTNPLIEALHIALLSRGLKVALLQRLPDDAMPTVVVLSDELVASFGGSEMA